MEQPAIAVRPIHHRRNAKSKLLIWLHFFCGLDSLDRLVCPLFYAIMRPSARHLDGSVHAGCTCFRDFTKLNSGSWRAQVRRKGKYVNETILRRKDAEEWALEVEQRIDHGEPAFARSSRDAKTSAI